MRRRALSILALMAAAAVASAPEEEEPFEVFSSFPGPFFFLSDSRTIVDYLVTVRASPEAFPPRGGWREVFEVEVDFEEEGLDLDDRVVFGNLARVRPDGLTVFTATVARVDVPDRGTLFLTDEQGITTCDEEGCIQRYVVRFVLSGFGFLSTRWFIRAGIDWDDPTQEVPEAATLTFDIRLL
ncbi:MAG: hypothetical protein AAFZ18_34855 [Myxococcota bacterium]